MNKFIQALCYIEFGDADWLGIVPAVLYIAGLWGLLKKSGLQGWWALIPGARSYQLARCAGRESEGKVYSLTEVAQIALNLLMLLAMRFTEEDTGALLSMFVLVLIIELVRFIYGIRVFGGLIEVYGLKRHWIWLCLLSFTRWIPALLWGWSKKYHPEWQVEDIRAEMARLASSGSATVKIGRAHV